MPASARLGPAAVVSGPKVLIAKRLEDAKAAMKADRADVAVTQLRLAASDAPMRADIQMCLGEALHAAGDRAAAEKAFRRVMTLDRTVLANEAAAELTYLLLELERTPEALALIAPLAKQSQADLAVLTAYAVALKTDRQTEAALKIYERAVAVAPTSGVAEHNLAAILGDMQRFDESEAAARRARDKGLDAPETLLAIARAMQGTGRIDQAAAAYRLVIERRPGDVHAHTDLAQLLWRLTQDVPSSVAYLDRVLSAYPKDQALRRIKATVLDNAGDRLGAYQVLVGGITREDLEPATHVAAALVLGSLEPNTALIHAQVAATMAPQDAGALMALCQSQLAAGQPEAASALADELRQRFALSQRVLALTATAWRLLEDPRYQQLYNYSDLVVAQVIDTPARWTSLETYLADLAVALRARATLPGHPIGQSLRQGSQTHPSLLRAEDEVIKAFFTAIDAPIRRYIDRIRKRTDPFSARAQEAYSLSGAWSALLRPGGHHVDHIHPSGWISSACHISLPGSIETGYEGWLKFGEPGIPTQPSLGPEHFVKPRSGHLILFPSYMWHGTLPFSGEDQRLAVAFDVMPGR